MKLSLLHKLFKNEISIDKFESFIQNEVEWYRRKLRTKGASITINVEEDFDLYFSIKNLIQLCKYYLDNCLTDTDMSYIADCLTLSESVSFENDDLFELLEEMTDNKLNGIIMHDRISEIINSFVNVK